MKRHIAPPQAGQSADRLNPVPKVNIVGPRAHLASRNVLYVAAAYLFLQAMGALSFVDRSIYGVWAYKGGDRFTEAINLLGITASLYLFWSSTRGARIARINRGLPLAAASLLLISALWSVDPHVTITQGTAYFFLVLGAIAMAETLDGDALMDLAAMLCGLCALASLVQIFIFPEPGDPRGIFVNKNMLGQEMAGGVLIALHVMRIRPRFRYICILAACTFAAFKSESETSMLAIAVFFLLDMLGRLYLKGGSPRMLSIGLAIAFVLSLIVFMINKSLIFELLGKDPTLTGRTRFWPYVIDNILQRPLLGWGYEAFWSPLNPAALQISEAIRRPGDWYLLHIANAHNGMLEFLLAIGFSGTLFFIFLWIRNFVMAMKCIKGPARHIGLSSVLLLIGILIIGVSEEVLISIAQIETLLFFLMGFMCEKQLWLERAARRQGMVRPAVHRRMGASDRRDFPRGPKPVNEVLRH